MIFKKILLIFIMSAQSVWCAEPGEEIPKEEQTNLKKGTGEILKDSQTLSEKQRDLGESQQNLEKRIQRLEEVFRNVELFRYAFKK